MGIRDDEVKAAVIFRFAAVGLAVLGIAWPGFVFAAPAAQTSHITSINFNNSAQSSEIDISSDAPLTYDKQENANDKQIVLDLTNAQLSKSASRNMDTSSFDSKVLLISPYQVDGDDGASGNARVVIQLRDMASAQVAQNGNMLKITIPNQGGQSADASTSPGSPGSDDAAKDIPPPPPGDAAAQAAAPQDAAQAAAQTDAAQTATAASTADTAQASAQTAGAAASTPVGVKDKLSEFIESRETHRFVGHPVTLKVRDADLMDVFRLIGDASGFNIIVGDDVKGKITLSLEDVPWDQALDAILQTQQLGAERNNNLLRIVTLTSLTKEKQAELAARQASEANSPRITRVFPVSYAKLDDLVSILSKFSSGTAAIAPPAPGGAPGAPAAAPAGNASMTVQADARTNSIIVRDTVENIERMRKLIEILDTQTPQVMIEAKIIEASEGFAKSIGGSLGFGNGTSNSQYFGSFAGADPIDPLFSNSGATAVFASGTAAGAASSATAPGGTFGLSPQLAFLPSNIRLNALLNLSESESNARVVSSPKAVVMNKEKANIVQSTPVLVPVISTTANGPVNTPTVEQANLSLDVTPTVTNDGSVLMQLTVSNDDPVSLGSGLSAVGNRNMSTKVLVESGSTLVMGGIYTMGTTDASSGFPILRKIPILGALFGNDQSSTTKSELFFFITPRILNPKEAGVSG